jgi:F-type H+-transporting ATPase subunit epsilon
VAEQLFTLKLFTPYKSVYEDQVEAIILPGEMGEFGMLYQHTKFASTLKPGMIRFVREGKTFKYAVSGGFVEIHEGGMTVLADSMELPEEIDLERAKASLERAKEMLAKKDQLEPHDIARWENRFERAQNRIKNAASL